MLASEQSDASFWELCQYNARWGGLRYNEGGHPNSDALLDGIYGAYTASGGAVWKPAPAAGGEPRGRRPRQHRGGPREAVMSCGKSL